MIFGYARVSTESQNLDRQLDALKNYGVDKVFTEKMTGTKKDRPSLNELRNILRKEDIVVIESLSRLGRSTKDLLNLIEEFNDNGVFLKSLKEDIDTSSPTGKLILTVLSALAQFERDLTVQRTQEGLKSARARGRVGGRPKKDKKVIEKALKLYDSKVYSIKEICILTGISQGTLYSSLKARN